MSALSFERYADLMLEDETDTWQSRENLYRYMSEVFFAKAENMCYVLEDEGKYLSSLRIEHFEDGYLVHALQTMKLERGKGYASALFEEMKKDIVLEEDKHIYSHILKNNKPSIVLHRQMGFQRLLDYAKLLDGSVSWNYFTMVI